MFVLKNIIADYSNDKLVLDIMYPVIISQDIPWVYIAVLDFGRSGKSAE